ncbi:MAG TPA: murein biosynthesis integral membrane protein MurJ [Ktedonobacterales bacterium]|nr:murein biosynthesis integral membrane protein MurJ [Ktedonobacterales bacterium]
MDRWREPVDQEQARRGQDLHDGGERDEQGQSAQARKRPLSAWDAPVAGPAGAKLWPDEMSANPPWEQESGRLPVAPPPGRGAYGSAEAAPWEWEPAADQSLPGVNDMTGTGRVPTIVPLSPNESSWGKGVRAPRPPRGDVEVDEQPSMRVRALRAGNLARATAIVTAALLLSRVLGLARTSLFAYTFGATVDADAFTNAFALPATIFNIVAGGALASAFIPVFADYLIDKRDRTSAWHIASSALNLSLVVLTALAALAFVFTPQFLNISLHPLFVNGNTEGLRVVELTRIMLLQPIFLGGATIAVAILQARQHFMLPAIGQVIYTLSLIGGTAVALVDTKTGIFGGHIGILGPTWGVVVGAVLQFLIQIPGLIGAKMHYALSFDIFHPGIHQIFRLMVPRIFNAALLFVSVFVNRSLLGLLNQPGATYGYVTAFTLVMLPLGVFGMAVSQAAFPTLAALVAANEWQRLRVTILQTVRGVTFLALPSSLGLIVLADPLSQLLLDHGSFKPGQVPLISQPLLFFSIGLLGLSQVEILTRCFYALHDTRTAVEVSILQFLFVIGLSVILLNPMGASGLALATALGSNGEALVLLLLLRPRLGGLDLRELGTFSLNVLAASVVSALSALFVYTLMLRVLPGGSASVRQTVYMVGRVSASIVAATIVYFVFSRFLGTDDMLSPGRIARRIFRR